MLQWQSSLVVKWDRIGSHFTLHERIHTKQIQSLLLMFFSVSSVVHVLLGWVTTTSQTSPPSDQPNAPLSPNTKVNFLCMQAGARDSHTPIMFIVSVFSILVGVQYLGALLF